MTPHSRQTRRDSSPYHSSQEADIAAALKEYGIPFFYKEPTLVIENGRRCIRYMDFFLPTYSGLAIDYIIESQSAIFRRKKNVYQDNGIPYHIVGRRDMERPAWRNTLYERIQRLDRRLSYRSKARGYR